MDFIKILSILLDLSLMSKTNQSCLIFMCMITSLENPSIEGLKITYK